MQCRFCNTELDPDRVEFLLDTNRDIVCQNCSTEESKLCLMSFSHKTAPELVILPQDKEAIRRAFRVFNRER